MRLLAARIAARYAPLYDKPQPRLLIGHNTWTAETLPGVIDVSLIDTQPLPVVRKRVRRYARRYPMQMAWWSIVFMLAGVVNLAWRDDTIASVSCYFIGVVCAVLWIIDMCLCLFRL